MTEPSEYELLAWREIRGFKGRPMSHAMTSAGEKVAGGVARVGHRTNRYLDTHPRTKAAVGKGQAGVAKGARAVSTTARIAAEAIPDGITEWTGEAFTAIRRTVARVSRVGLSSKQVVALHKKRDHPVSSLHDLRQLDLQQIDIVRGRGLSWYYPAAAALSGMGAGLVISGGEIFVTASAGAAAAPSGAVIAGAFAGDIAIVLGLASRCVGHVSLYYGYDPESPAEKLFVLSVVNAGTAMSSGAKTAAFADISRLTQALVRGKTWAELNKSIVSRVSSEFAKRFGFRLTKQGLGKVVPIAGIAIGGAFNWATLEGIVDAADVAYRRRFLLEKYPHLAKMGDANHFEVGLASASEHGDDVISLTDEIAEAGGPDLR